MNSEEIANALYGKTTPPPAQKTNDAPTADQLATAAARPSMTPEERAAMKDGNDAAAAAESAAAAAESAAADKVTAEKVAAEKSAAETPTKEGEFKIQVPDNVAELRKGDSARKLYGAEGTYKGTDGLEATFEGAELPAEHQAAAIKEFREMAADLQLEPNQFRDVVPLIKQYFENPPDAKTEGEWRKSAQLELERVYGSKEEAAKAANLARELVKRDPRVARILDETGLGSHPQVVILLAERARTIAGRL